MRLFTLIFFHSCMYVTPIKLSLIKLYRSTAYLLEIRHTAIFVFLKLGLFGPCWTDVAVSGAQNYVASAENLRLWISNKTKPFGKFDSSFR